MFNNIFNIKTIKQMGNEPLSVTVKEKFCCVGVDGI